MSTVLENAPVGDVSVLPQSTAPVTSEAKPKQTRNRKAKAKLEPPTGRWATSRIDAFEYKVTATPQPKDFSDESGGYSELHCQFMEGQFAEQLIAYYRKIREEIASLTPEQRKEMAETKRNLTSAKKAVETLGIKALDVGLDALKGASQADLQALMAKLSQKLAAM